MSKLRRDKGSGSQKLPPLSIPKVFITSEDDSTPPTGKGDFPMDMLLQGQVYSKDEDTGSTAPLLDSGTATPLCEEPSVPLNMGTFLASKSVHVWYNLITSNNQLFSRFTEAEN